MIWVYYFLLLGCAAVGLLLVLFTLPGLWLMTAAAAAYALLTHGRVLGVHVLWTLLILTVIGELLDWLAGAVGVGRAGGGRNAKIGALVGGIVGGIFLTFIPIPIVGTILGICLGSFIGAAGAEWYGGGQAAHSLRVGVGAAKGRVAGFIAKLILGGVMMLLILCAAFP
jgi:uncharacterized protein